MDCSSNRADRPIPRIVHERIHGAELLDGPLDEARDLAGSATSVRTAEGRAALPFDLAHQLAQAVRAPSRPRPPARRRGRTRARFRDRCRWWRR
jgi:hypothetical protein